MLSNPDNIIITKNVLPCPTHEKGYKFFIKTQNYIKTMNIQLHSTSGFKQTSIDTLIGSINLPEETLQQIAKGKLTLQLSPTINVSNEKVVEFRIGLKETTKKITTNT